MSTKQISTAASLGHCPSEYDITFIMITLHYTIIIQTANTQRRAKNQPIKSQFRWWIQKAKLSDSLSAAGLVRMQCVGSSPRWQSFLATINLQSYSKNVKVFEKLDILGHILSVLSSNGTTLSFPFIVGIAIVITDKQWNGWAKGNCIRWVNMRTQTDDQKCMMLVRYVNRLASYHSLKKTEMCV